jgi:hypothetical protein
MAEEIEIYNMALIRLGVTEMLTAPDQAVRNAKILNKFYASARDAVLAAHPWNFAMARAELVASGSAPDFEFNNAFDLPTNPHCLRVWKIYDSDGYEWKVEGRQILTDLGAPLKISYIKRVTDTAQFSPNFVAALVDYLAAVTALAITQSATNGERLEKAYLQKIGVAQGSDGQEGTPDVIDASYLLDERNLD